MTEKRDTVDMHAPTIGLGRCCETCAHVNWQHVEKAGCWCDLAKKRSHPLALCDDWKRSDKMQGQVLGQLVAIQQEEGSGYD